MSDSTGARCGRVTVTAVTALPVGPVTRGPSLTDGQGGGGRLWAVVAAVPVTVRCDPLAAEGEEEAVVV